MTGVGGRARRWIAGGAGVGGVLVLWAALSRMLAGDAGAIDRLAGPMAVAGELVAYATDGLLPDLASSVRIFAIGWLGGGAVAAVVGLLLGRVRILGRMFLPIVEAIRPVSSIAWVPLSIVWFGFELAGKVFLVGLAVFLVVIVYAVDGSTRIAPDLIRTTTMLGMSPLQRFRYLVLPGTLSEVLIGFRVGLMAGWGTVIIAELVAADSGLGAHLMAVQRGYDVAAVMSTMVCFAVAGFAMTVLFGWAERRLLPWRQDGRGEDR